MEYFGEDGDRMHMMFNFQVNQNLFYALAAADKRPLVKALKATKPRPATAQWGMFLRNHDELDLGRLTDEQRQKVFDAFGPIPEDAALRSGHPAAAGADAQRRSPSARARLQPDVHAARHARPRYGDELGMGDDLICRSGFARAHRCSGRPSRKAASPRATSRSCRSSATGPYGYRARQCSRCSGAIPIRC